MARTVQSVFGAGQSMRAGTQTEQIVDAKIPWTPLRLTLPHLLLLQPKLRLDQRASCVEVVACTEEPFCPTQIVERASFAWTQSLLLQHLLVSILLICTAWVNLVA